jgi:hypothetical protein
MITTMEVGNIFLPWSSFRYIMMEELPRSTINSHPPMTSSLMEADSGSIPVINVRIWLNEGNDSCLFFLRYAGFSPRCQFIYVIFVNNLSLPIACLYMALRGRMPSRTTKVSIDAVEFYEDYVLDANKAIMTELEEEVCQIREFHDDDEVEV